jgi:hypothetical protein
VWNQVEALKKIERHCSNREFGWAIFRFFRCGIAGYASSQCGFAPRGRLCSNGVHGVTRGRLGVLLIKLFDNLRTSDNRKAQANRGQRTTDAAFRISGDKRDLANTSLDALVLSRLLPVEGTVFASALFFRQSLRLAS